MLEPRSETVASARSTETRNDLLKRPGRTVLLDLHHSSSLCRAALRETRQPKGSLVGKGSWATCLGETQGSHVLLVGKLLLSLMSLQCLNYWSVQFISSSLKSLFRFCDFWLPIGWSTKELVWQVISFTVLSLSVLITLPSNLLQSYT